jgi:hemoglobin
MYVRYCFNANLEYKYWMNGPLDLDSARRGSQPGTRSSTVMNLLYQRIGGHEGISGLLRHFYADVRQDPLIGPVFNAQIDDWKRHLEVLASFWETVIGGPSTYAGRMPMKHLSLRLREEDFERWLFLWQANCRAQLPSDVAKEMIDLADHIARRLRIILDIPNT